MSILKFADSNSELDENAESLVQVIETKSADAVLNPQDSTLRALVTSTVVVECKL